MPDKSFAKKFNLIGKGNPSADPERNALAEDIETRVAGDVRMRQNSSGNPLTMVSVSVREISFAVREAISELDEGKGATPKDISLCTGFSLEVVMLVLCYEEHRVESRWFDGGACTRYKLKER